MCIDNDLSTSMVSKNASVAVEADCPGLGIVGQADADGILVGCSDGALRIMRLQKEGAKRLAAAEFLAGNPLPVGTQLG